MSLPQRKLGATGMSVSCLGLGTVKFGRNQELKYPHVFAVPEDNEVKNLLSQAREMGFNLLDTAPAYGSAEQRLGRLIDNRDDWLICTKVGEEFLTGKSVHDFSGDHVRTSVERSLRNLATDVLDIVLVHSDGRDEHIIDNTDCLDTLQQLKDKGLIRAIGMSTKTTTGGLRSLDHCDVVMVTYNPGMTDDLAVIEKATELNKGVLIKKALFSGHVGEDGDYSAADCLRFALKPEGVSSVIIGTINPEHLQENVDAVTP